MNISSDEVLPRQSYENRLEPVKIYSTKVEPLPNEGNVFKVQGLMFKEV